MLANEFLKKYSLPAASCYKVKDPTMGSKNNVALQSLIPSQFPHTKRFLKCLKKKGNYFLEHRKWSGDKLHIKLEKN